MLTTLCQIILKVIVIRQIACKEDQEVIPPFAYRMAAIRSVFDHATVMADNSSRAFTICVI